MIRQDAIYNVDFAGFLTYAWGGNNMNITAAEQIQHEYYYRSRLTLRSEKPQWLSDSAINVNGTVIPLSWSQPLNWKGGVPNAPGAEVNLWRTLKANRTITLDGSKTAGNLTFDSPYNYTIAPGTGGSLILDNSASAAGLTSTQGSHTISAGVQLASGLTADINTGTFTISGIVSGSGGLVKNGAGTLALTNANTFTGNTHVHGGVLRTNGPYFADASQLFVSTGGAIQLNFTGSPDVIGSFHIDGVQQHQGIWGPIGSAADYTTPLLTGSGLLQVTSGPVAGDFNDDGLIDSADYILWRKNFGAPYSDADYNAWRRNFNALGAGASSVAAAFVASTTESNIPEPSSACQFLILVCAILLYWPHVQTRSTTVRPAFGAA
jgi:autotransporter-associated beta strand protein